MSKILIVAEHDGDQLNPSTAKCVDCATNIGDEIHILVLGDGVAGVAAQAAELNGVGEVLVTEAEHLAAPIAANWAQEVVALADDYTHLLGPATTFGKDLMPRVAGLLGVNQVTDIMAVEGPRNFKRPIYAGNAIVDVETPEGLTVVGTVRTASWDAVESGNDAPVTDRPAASEPVDHTRYIGLDSGGDGDRPDLQTARVVLSGGRGLASADNFELLYTVADKLGAGVGASRAAVDAGYVPNDMQVGQTGKIISPDLYMAFGISGAIQHLTGIKDAGTIVAVNKDPDAPIFEIADIGLVGDLFTVLPELDQMLD